MVQLLRLAGAPSAAIKLVKEIVDTCRICRLWWRPTPKSMTHVRLAKDFNNVIQWDDPKSDHVAQMIGAKWHIDPLGNGKFNFKNWKCASNGGDFYLNFQGGNYEGGDRNVIVWDDPINLMSYVTFVFRKVFGYSEEKAHQLMMEVHVEGRSVVSSGNREKAELDVFRLHEHGLWATLEQDS